jgi:hypothetical protein
MWQFIRHIIQLCHKLREKFTHPTGFVRNKKIAVNVNSLIRILSSNSNFSYQIERTASRETVLNFFSHLHPENFGFNLIRIGNEFDGGYLVPDDLENIIYCLSPGVGDSIDFESTLLSNYGIKSELADPTIDKIDNLPIGIKHSQVGVGHCTEKGTLFNMKKKIREEFDLFSLEDFLTRKIPNDSGDLILQMDIENSEYLTLLSTKPEVLSRFRIMIIEFHSIPDIFHKKYYSEVVEPLFSKLNEMFYVSHLHANNVAEPVKILNFCIPHSLEVTFHNRDRVIDSKVERYEDIHHILDSPSDPKKPEVYLDKKLFDLGFK